MKTKKLLSSVMLAAFLFPAISFSQSKWAENDDMYFSKKDREKIYASANNNLDHSNLTDEQSEYAANHNFGSPTVQSTSAGSPTVQPEGNPNDANNQYFIKDYSLPKDKTYESLPITTYGNTPSFNNRPNVNVMLSYGMGYGFGSPYRGFNSSNRFYNPYNDPFSPYYDPFFSYYDPWNYTSFGYDPWRYNGFGFRDNRFGINGYNSANWCPTNGFTNYSSNVRNEVRYRNGRKVISGSRNASATSRSRSNRVAISDRPAKSSSSVKTNGRSSSRASRGGSYRKYPNSAYNRTTNKARTNRVNTSNRTNRNSNSSNWNNSSNRSSNNYRSSGSSSGSRSSSYSRPSTGSRSSGSGSRPSSGSSRSSGRRGN